MSSAYWSISGSYLCGRTVVVSVCVELRIDDVASSVIELDMCAAHLASVVNAISGSGLEATIVSTPSSGGGCDHLVGDVDLGV